MAQTHLPAMAAQMYCGEIPKLQMISIPSSLLSGNSLSISSEWQAQRVNRAGFHIIEQ
jgi:hypothetical protein